MIVRLRVILSVFVITAAVVLGSTFVTYQFGNQVLRAHQRKQIRRQVIFDLDEITSIVSDDFQRFSVANTGVMPE